MLGEAGRVEELILLRLPCTRNSTSESRMTRADGDGSCRRRASGEGRRGHQADLQDRDTFIRIVFVLRVVENKGWDLGLTLFKIVVLFGGLPFYRHQNGAQQGVHVRRVGEGAILAIREAADLDHRSWRLHSLPRCKAPQGRRALHHHL